MLAQCCVATWFKPKILPDKVSPPTLVRLPSIQPCLMHVHARSHRDEADKRSGLISGVHAAGATTATLPSSLPPRDSQARQNPGSGPDKKNLLPGEPSAGMVRPTRHQSGERRLLPGSCLDRRSEDWSRIAGSFYFKWRRLGTGICQPKSSKERSCGAEWRSPGYFPSFANRREPLEHRWTSTALLSLALADHLDLCISPFDQAVVGPTCFQWA